MDKNNDKIKYKSENSNNNEADVIIIGAGMSGVACGEILNKNGISCIILEARDRIGGRIYTYDKLDAKVDVGASFIHGASYENPLFRIKLLI